MPGKSYLVDVYVLNNEKYKVKKVFEILNNVAKENRVWCENVKDYSLQITVNLFLIMIR